jgi:hypothetical protein
MQTWHGFRIERGGSDSQQRFGAGKRENLEIATGVRIL